MKFKDFIKLPPEQQEAFWKQAQEKAAKRTTA